jgi:hypothetical protein
LNIIENVWGVLARRVYAEGRQFDSTTDLTNQIRLEWSKIDKKYIRKLVKNMPKRLRLLSRGKGGPIPY